MVTTRGRDRRGVENGSSHEMVLSAHCNTREANKNKALEPTKIIVNSVNREIFNSFNMYFCHYNKALIVNIINKLV